MSKNVKAGWNVFDIRDIDLIDGSGLKKVLEDFKGSLDGELRYIYLIKAKTADGLHYSLSKLTHIDSESNCDVLASEHKLYFSSLDDYYSSVKFKSLFIYYKALTVDYKVEVKSDRSFTLKTLFARELPLTMDIKKWGGCVTDTDGTIIIDRLDGNCVHVEVDECGDQKYKVFKNNHLVFTFIDRCISDGQFERIIKVSDSKIKKLIIKDEKIIWSEVKKKHKMLNSLKREGNVPDFNVLTFEIEYYLNEENRYVPYLCGFYSLNYCQTYYLTDYCSYDEMLNAAIESILIPKLNGYRVYCHNLSKSDSLFLLPVLLKLGEVSVVENDSGIIKLTLKAIRPHSKNKAGIHSLNFLDSSQQLPGSLEELGISFNVPVIRHKFPHLFASKENLNYRGSLPELKYWNGINEFEYNALRFKKPYDEMTWDFKVESIRYCKSGLISLYDILKSKFDYIFLKYGVNILKSTTLSGLAMKIYRSNFMESHFRIPLLNGRTESDIRKAYYGGIVNITKTKGENLYQYDVNSLYPFMMLKPLPVGNPTHIKGDIPIDKILSSDMFGFFMCHIEAPKLHLPFLPYRYEKKTITPIGTWSSWYFSEEVKKAAELGYQIKISEGYVFEKSVIFSSYVNHFFKVKKETQNSVERKLSKLFLNTLYGIIGKKMERYKTIVVKPQQQIPINYPILDVKQLNDGSELVRLIDNGITGLYEDYQQASVAIAAAITAYARVFMYDFKTISGNPCLYSDTDSIFIEKPLDESLVGSNIGQFKLERIIKEAVFIAPKAYGFIETNGNEVVIIKGLSANGIINVPYSSLKQLELDGKKINIHQTRSFKDINNATVFVDDIKYTLSKPYNHYFILRNGHFIDYYIPEVITKTV